MVDAGRAERGGSPGLSYDRVLGWTGKRIR